MSDRGKFPYRRAATKAKREARRSTGPDLRLFAAMPSAEECRSAYPPDSVREELLYEARAQIAQRPDLRLLGGAQYVRIGGDGIEQGLPTEYGYLAIYPTDLR